MVWPWNCITEASCAGVDCCSDDTKVAFGRSVLVAQFSGSVSASLSCMVWQSGCVVELVSSGAERVVWRGLEGGGRASRSPISTDEPLLPVGRG